MKKPLLFFLIFFTTLEYSAQERFGITNSNYYSTAAIQLNPSASVDSRTYMQLHLVGFNAFAKTNFAYLPNFNVRQITNIPEPVRTSGDNKKFLYVNSSLEGPAFVISKRTYGAGFFIRARSVFDMRRVSYELASTLLNGQGLAAPENRDLLGQNFRNAKFSNMSWVEYGVNFGKMIKRQQDVLISVGGNLKYLTGINILYTNIIEFNSYNNDNGSFGISSLNAKVLRNDPHWKAGKGAAFDLGITYKIMEGYVDKYYANSKLSNCNYVDYKCKIGLALRDIGFVRFKGQTTDTRVTGGGYFDPYRSDTAFVEAIEYNFKNTTTQGKPIWAWLPSSLTGQLDYNFDNSIYLNVTAVKNLVPTQITGVQGPDVLAITPRAEFRQFEFALPLSFQRYRYPMLGFGIRFRSFVVGVDNMFPLFMSRNTYGIGVYASLAISLFRNPACNTKRMSISDCPRYKKNGKNKVKKGRGFPGSRRH